MKQLSLYYLLLITYMNTFFIYRTRILFVVLSAFLAPFVMIQLFSNLPGSRFAGMTKEQLVTYYLGTSILYLFMNSKIDGFIKDTIQQGELATYLVKPVNFLYLSLMQDLSGRVVRLFFGIPLFILLSSLYQQATHPLTVESFILLPILLISFLLSFQVSYIVGLTTFWLDEVWGLQNLKEVAVLLLGGVVLPYSFFPHALQKVVLFTPFPYMVNWPMRNGFTGNILIEIITAFFWVIVLQLLSLVLWKKGLKKYSAQGV